MADPTAQEVLMWSYINRARLDPNGEAARFEITLNEGPVKDFDGNLVTLTGTSKQPLAFNSSLYAAADAHAVDMLNRGPLFFHNDPNNPNITPHARALANGYNSSPNRSVGENMAGINSQGTLNETQAVTDMYRNLFVDKDWDGRGHRYNILLDDYNEVGVGQAMKQVGGLHWSSVVQDFGKSGSAAQFLTGTAYNDTDGNKFYSIGEGRGGIVVQTTAGGITTQTAGNFSKAINAGVQTVTFSGGNLSAPVSVSAEVLADRNAMINLVDQSTVETSVSVTALDGVTKIIGLGNLGLKLAGNGRNNVIVNALGNDRMDGAAGSDTAVFSESRASYSIVTNADGSVTVAGLGQTDTLVSIEKIQFKDQLVLLSGPAPVAGTVVVSDSSVVEGNAGTQVMTFTVTRSGGTAAFDVSYATQAGTASSVDSDFAGTSNTLKFAAGEMQKKISVVINGDTKVEGNETFNLNLSNATNGATISDPTGIGTITNDDVAPVAGSIVIGDTTITEGNAGTQVMNFTVTRSGGIAAFNVNFATKAGTASSADADYVGRSNTLSFAAGEMQKTISVTVNGDTKVEGTETFNVVLSDATNGATISDAIAVGRITNDDVTRVTEDFNGDGNSDVLFHNNNGSVAMWMQDGFTTIANRTVGPQITSWHVEGTEDFGGDGKADILWHNDNGQVQLWHMNGATASQVQNLGSMPTNWHVGGIDDFNGDGKAEVLWFSNSNQVQVWNVNNGAVTSQTVGTIGAGWSIKDTADFTGDGKADILLQKGTSIAMWEMDGARIAKSTTFATMGDSFHFAGAEDFNGDGKSDILWHNDSNGQGVLWELDGTNILSNTTAGWTAAGWDIADLGDFNHDGRADILLRNGTTGALAEWQMDGDQVLKAQGIGSASIDWHVV